MSYLSYNGDPIGKLPRTPGATDPNGPLPGDRQLMDMLRNGKFEEAKQAFPGSYNSAHIGFLCQMTGRAAPSDESGLIAPLSDSQLVAALDFLEGPMRPVAG